MKLFISWIGTDKNGNNLVSSGERFMNFRNYNLAGLYKTILETSNRSDVNTDEPFDIKLVNFDVLQRIATPPLATQNA